MPLISVIIPCYNHGRYLADAVQSVLQQSFRPVEIIVVDDGSTDNTKAVAQRFAEVKYVYQANAGLSAARNTGIDHSTGDYLVFLDADDWLLDGALQTNYTQLAEHDELAFVSGGHIKTDWNKKLLKQVHTQITSDHYQWFLRLNYIGMHASVLFRRWAFDAMRYDTSLKACEDYDVYLKIARHHPVAHHMEPIAAYRMHHQNMSGNIPLMLDSVLQVLNRQQPVLQSEAETTALQEGLKTWKGFYTNALYQHLVFSLCDKNRKAGKADVVTLKTYDPALYATYEAQRQTITSWTKPNKATSMKGKLKEYLPAKALYWYHKLRNNTTFTPPPGGIDLGDLNRTKPFSKQFGYDRGGPVDRYYIENFLQQQAHYVKGRVLEIGDDEYTRRFSGGAVAQSDVLHIAEGNPKATFVGDLSDAPHLPDNAFDCIILTQTLHLIYDFKGALQTCCRILKPGGALLLTVPGISHIDQGEWKAIWLWSFTQASMKRLLSETFSDTHIEVATFGNVLAATAFLYGMGLPELKQAQMDVADPHYPLIITARAIKSLDT